MQSPPSSRNFAGVAPARALAIAASAALMLFGVATGKEATVPTETSQSRPSEKFTGDIAMSEASSSDVTIEGTIPLPISQTHASAGPAFRIDQSGLGINGWFGITNSMSVNSALHATTLGSGSAFQATGGRGPAGRFETNTKGNNKNVLEAISGASGDAFYAEARGSAGNAVMAHLPSSYGRTAGSFWITSAFNNGTALEARTSGGGRALLASTTGRSYTAIIESKNPNGVLATLWVSNQNNADAVWATTSGTGGRGGLFEIRNATNAKAAIEGKTDGSGWAGYFSAVGASGKGVYIEAPTGNAGLVVSGGTKSAAVETADGGRLLYTEESTEVWFTDYGFENLVDGRVFVAFDSKFGETVNANERYHVFLQPYGDAELMVRNRTPAGFDVVLRAGSEKNAEFSYRVVAKRRGFEKARLERAPHNDNGSL